MHRAGRIKINKKTLAFSFRGNSLFYNIIHDNASGKKKPMKSHGHAEFCMALPLLGIS